jgi:hypothetical protein
MTIPHPKVTPEEERAIASDETQRKSFSNIKYFQYFDII